MIVRDISGRGFALGFLLVLATGLAVAYANGFGIGFYFDDGYGITENPAIRSLRNIPAFFTDPFTLTPLRTNVDIRPVLVTTFAVNYAISGTDPWSYHAFNLLVHFLTAAMVFVLVRDHLWWPVGERGPSGSARIPAAAAALFFAFAPVNSQALNYMWARSALLCTAFYVAAFLALLRGRWITGVALHVLALLTKAVAFTLPAVFVLHDFLYRDRRRHPHLAAWLRDWRRLAVPVGSLAVANVLYLLLRWRMVPAWADDFMHEGWVTPWIWFVSQWSALLHYVRIFVWPAGLSVDHDFPYTLSAADPSALLSLSVLLAWIALALRASRRWPQVTFATLWFFVTLAPESSFLPLAEVVNDHRPYIASTVGLSVLLTWTLERGAALAGSRRREAFVAAATVLCLAAVTVTRQRTLEWADGLRLWESTVRASPGNGRAWMNAGLAYMNAGDFGQARRHFEKSRELNARYPYVYMNLVALELAEGHEDAALAWAREAVRFGPELPRSHYSLGTVLERQGNAAEAVAAYRLACRLDPNDAVSRAALARAEAMQARGNAAPR